MAAANQPTVEELMTLIQNLQGQVAALTQAQANALNANPAPVAFADTPGTLGVEAIIDYKTKQGTAIYDKGCEPLDDKALTDGFDMSLNQTVVFVEALHRKATQMGWNQGTKNITSFINRDGKTIDIIKEYGQIDEATLKTQCERFCKVGGVDAQTRAKQNNTMMHSCLSKTLTASAQAKLLNCRDEYIFDGVEYAPLMYKIIMRLTTMDSVATNQSLRENLQALPTFAATVKGNIDKIHEEFDKNYSQLISRGATVDDPIQLLFDAYDAVPCYNFKKYIMNQQDAYLDGKLAGLTHNELRKMAKSKFDWLVNKKRWGARSPDDEKIVAMAAEINALKGQLKLSPKLAELANNKDEGNNKKEGKRKNKKDTSNKKNQKKDEAWKKTPPKDGEPKHKKHGDYTYHWCEHHMAWTVHKPAACRLGKQHKEDQKSAHRADSATVAATAAAATINPHYAALLATLGKLEQEDE
jgi:hypothetical protein